MKIQTNNIDRCLSFKALPLLTSFLSENLTKKVRFIQELPSASSSMYFRFGAGEIDFIIRVADHSNTSRMHQNCIAQTILMQDFISENEEDVTVDLADFVAQIDIKSIKKEIKRFYKGNR